MAFYTCIEAFLHLFMHCPLVFCSVECFVFDKMLKWHFCVELDLNEFHCLDLLLIEHVCHVLVNECVFNTLCPFFASMP